MNSQIRNIYHSIDELTEQIDYLQDLIDIQSPYTDPVYNPYRYTDLPPIFPYPPNYPRTTNFSRQRLSTLGNSRNNLRNNSNTSSTRSSTRSTGSRIPSIRSRTAENSNNRTNNSTDPITINSSLNNVNSNWTQVPYTRPSNNTPSNNAPSNNTPSNNAPSNNAPRSTNPFNTILNDLPIPLPNLPRLGNTEPQLFEVVFNRTFNFPDLNSENELVTHKMVNENTELDVRTTEDEAHTCSICRVDIEPGDITRTINTCGHYFHQSCIDKWFEEKNTCPVCRQTLVPENNTNNENSNTENSNTENSNTENTNTENNTYTTRQIPIGNSSESLRELINTLRTRYDLPPPS